MTIDRSYRCDLCRSMHNPNTDAFYGIYWGGHPETIQERPVWEVEHHLCLKCITGVVAIFQKIRLPDSASENTAEVPKGA